MGEKEILIKGLSVRKENDYCHISVASFFFGSYTLWKKET